MSEEWRTKSNEELMGEARKTAVDEETWKSAAPILEEALKRRHEPQWDAFLNGVFGRRSAQ